MDTADKIWADAVRDTGIWMAPYAEQVGDFGRIVLPKLKALDARRAELGSIIRELLDVWDPEWEPGKSLRQRALAALSET
jgi:hypothetical protein